MSSVRMLNPTHWSFALHAALHVAESPACHPRLMHPPVLPKTSGWSYQPAVSVVWAVLQDPPASARTRLAEASAVEARTIAQLSCASPTTQLPVHVEGPCTKRVPRCTWKSASGPAPQLPSHADQQTAKTGSPPRSLGPPAWGGDVVDPRLCDWGGLSSYDYSDGKLPNCLLVRSDEIIT